MSRNRRRFYAIAVTLAATALARQSSFAAQEMPNPWERDASPGLAALASAHDEGRYAFVFFWKQNDQPTQQLHGVFQSAVKGMPGVDAVSVCVADPHEAATVKLFGVDRAPMPLVAAVAPNGAVTKAWPLKFTAEQLSAGIVSRGTAECLKAMQEQKLTLLCVRNNRTAHNLVAATAVSGFKADERFAAATAVVEIDPADASEQTFLTTLKINPKTADAVTVLLSPAGQPIAQFAGAVTTEQLVEKVTSAQAGCCPGGQCGPGGCCPGGQCGPAK